ncbi:hypothetical protein [Phytopseudomonas dryadis]|nr:MULTISPECIES: hypothetical protein [Pseudomonas]
MIAMRRLLLVLLLPLLSACGSGEQDEGAPQKKSEPAVVRSELVAPAPAPATPAPEVKAPPLPEPKPQAQTAAPSVPAKPAAPAARPAEKVTRTPPKTKLDLSLPAELAAQLNAEDQAVEERLAPILPPMFEEKAPSLDPFQLSGKLITSDRGDDYWDSVEGAELQFEFRR